MRTICPANLIFVFNISLSLKLLCRRKISDSVPINFWMAIFRSLACVSSSLWWHHVCIVGPSEGHQNTVEFLLERQLFLLRGVLLGAPPLTRRLPVGIHCVSPLLYAHWIDRNIPATWNSYLSSSIEEKPYISTSSGRTGVEGSRVPWQWNSVYTEESGTHSQTQTLKTLRLICLLMNLHIF